MYFKDKVVLISGGSSGIGLALAHELARQGANLYLLARTQHKLAAALNELHAISPAAHQAISVDVTDASQVSKVVQKIIDEVGVPDLLINSAGAAHPGYAHKLGLDIYRWMMEVNYFGTLHLTRAVLPGMIERRSGHIVNIASLAALVGVFGYTAYGASKYAVRGFSDALRAEVKPFGVNISIAYPPDTDTPQLAYENQYKPPELKYLLPELGVLRSEQVAHAILRGVKNRRYVILTDTGSRLIYLLIWLLGNGSYPVMDWLVARAQRKAQRNIRN